MLQQGKCRAEVFHDIGDQLLNGDIDQHDYFAMSEMLGFEIRSNEEKEILRSLHKEFFGVPVVDDPRPAIQKSVHQA